MHAWALPAAIKVACDDAADAGGGIITWTVAQPPATGASAAAGRHNWCRSLPCQITLGQHIPLRSRRTQRRPGHVTRRPNYDPPVPAKLFREAGDRAAFPEPGISRTGRMLTGWEARSTLAAASRAPAHQKCYGQKMARTSDLSWAGCRRLP
jgi:hypothetical protein